MLPRQWLPLNPGTIVGTPARLPAPNPFGINWPKAQFANPSYVGSKVSFKPLGPIPAAERVGAGPMHWSWAQFGTGKQNLPRFAPNPRQKAPEVLYSGPEDVAAAAPKAGGNAIPVILGLLTLGAFVMIADRTLAPAR